MILLSHDLGQHFVKSMGETKWPPTHAPTPFSAPSPSSVPHICPCCMPHNFRFSPMTQLPTHLILRYPLPTPVWPFRPLRHQLFPLELPKCIYPKPPIFCPRVKSKMLNHNHNQNQRPSQPTNQSNTHTKHHPNQ